MTTPNPLSFLARIDEVQARCDAAQRWAGYEARTDLPAALECIRALQSRLTEAEALLQRAYVEQLRDTFMPIEAEIKIFLAGKEQANDAE